MATFDRDPAGGAIAHVPALDGLRGLAIALVLLTHFGVSAGFAQRYPGAAGAWMERLAYIGWIGVDLFFVLSGFLITSILLVSRDDPGYYGRFYGRRALRIFPLYITALIVGLYGLPATLPAQAPALLGDAVRGQLFLWTYTLNIANTFGWVANAGVLAQMWTLAIEEQFYLAWPWLVRQTSARSLTVLCAALVIGALALRTTWIALEGQTAWPAAYRFTLTRIDALAIGALIAVAWRHPPVRTRVAAAAPGTLGITGAALAMWFLAAPRFYPDQPGIVTVGHSLLAVFFAALTVTALASPARWMHHAAMRRLGRYSYGIYVWHWFVQYPMVLYASDLHPAAFFAFGIAVSIGLGLVSYHLLELPFLRLKHRLRYGGRKVTPVAV